jgi:hypothetical protein
MLLMLSHRRVLVTWSLIPGFPKLWSITSTCFTTAHIIKIIFYQKEQNVSYRLHTKPQPLQWIPSCLPPSTPTQAMLPAFQPQPAWSPRAWRAYLLKTHRMMLPSSRRPLAWHPPMILTQAKILLLPASPRVKWAAFRGAYAWATSLLLAEMPQRLASHVKLPTSPAQTKVGDTS